MLLTARVHNKGLPVQPHQTGGMIDPFIIESEDDFGTGRTFGYLDISTIENWFDIGMHLDRDYLFVRREIKKLIALKGTEGLQTCTFMELTTKRGGQYLIEDETDKNGMVATRENLEWHIEDPTDVGYRKLEGKEQSIAFELCLGSIKDHQLNYSVEEIVAIRNQFDAAATLCRGNRIRTAKTYMNLELSRLQCIEVLSNLLKFNLYNLYEQFGILGTEENYHPLNDPTPTPGICDYLLSRDVFSQLGMATKDWQPESLPSLKDLCSKLYGVLALGSVSSTVRDNKV